MGRGLRLACEDCDFSAEMEERAPFVLDADGEPRPAPEVRRSTPDGYWADWLCGDCRLPQRETLPADAATNTEDGPRCQRCGAALMSFETSLRELAEAGHSRVWLDLAAERYAFELLRRADAALPELLAAWERGDTTTQMALDELAALLAPPTDRHDLGATNALAGFAPLIENAADLYRAGDLLASRIVLSERHTRTLESWRDDEAQLPGVPCPKCGTGQLVHWPVWS